MTEQTSPYGVTGLVCAAVVLLTLSALFSISESALLVMNKLTLRIKCKSRDKRALAIARLLRQKDELINSLLAANCLVNIWLSSLAAKAAMQIWGDGALSAAAVAATILLLVFGEITPKTLAAHHADRIAYGLSPFIVLTVTVFRPVARAFTFAANKVLSILASPALGRKRSAASPAHSPAAPSYTEDDIKTVISEGAASGALAPDESAMAQGVFRFTDLEAQDIMVPRKDIVAIGEDKTIGNVTSLFRTTGRTRFPVYKGTIDNIIGVLYVKDLVHAQPDAPLASVMRPPLFILGTKKMSSVEAMLQENHQSMAIVVDEYSGTDGLLTSTDIINRVFHIGLQSSQIFTVPGNALLDEVSDTLHVPIRSDINETLGGWLTEMLGDLPQAGNTVDFGGYRFCITEVRGRCVQSVRITHAAPSQDTV